jgi:hypothetical protein
MAVTCHPQLEYVRKGFAGSTAENSHESTPQSVLPDINCLPLIASGTCILSEPTASHDHDHDHDGNCRPREMKGQVTDYDHHGVRFQFPADWTLTEQSNDDEITISLQSDGTTFWTLMLFAARPDPEEILDTVVAAFQQDYEEVDVLTAIESISGLPALGQDLDFVCYDLVNSAAVRTFQTSEATVMVLSQGTDHELKETQSQLDAITASLQCDDEV